MRTLLIALLLTVVAGAAFAASGPPPHLRRAMELSMVNPPQLKEAIAEMRIAIDREFSGSRRETAWAWCWIGNTYRRMGDLAQAEKSYRRVWPAMRDEEPGREAALEIARVYAARKQYDRAMAMFDEVLPAMKHEREVSNLSSARLGIILPAKRWERAVEEVEWAAARKSANDPSLRNTWLMSHAARIAAWLSMEKPRNSGQLVDRMLAKVPAASMTPLLFAALARCDRAIGRPAATLKYLERALANAKERDSYLSEAHFEAALSYEALKDKTKALKHLNKVLALVGTGDPYAKAQSPLCRQHLAYVSRGMTGKRPAALPLPTCRPLQWTPGVPANARFSPSVPMVKQ